MGIFIRCAGHNGPNEGYRRNERQGGAMHRPYGGIRNGPPQDRYRAAQGSNDM